VKLVTVIGARPQFIKASAVSAALGKQKTIQELIVHTGQHYDENMSGVFFKELGIPEPTINLGIGSKSHGAMTGEQLVAIEQVLMRERPDWVLVYGDTNSTLAGALAACKLGIPVAHVEAGLRSFNRTMPEEINRVLTDQISELLLVPTDMAMRNLAREGIRPDHCFNVGDVMYDAALSFSARAREQSSVMETLGLEPGAYLLLTVHRAVNTDDPRRLGTILAALNRVSQTLPVIWPIHPRTRRQMRAFGLVEGPGAGLRLIDPVGYLDMVMLEQQAALIATDSGGVQKEAFFYEVPCVTLREETEWVELVEAGWNRLLAPLDADQLVEAVLAAIGSKGKSIHPYGDGAAAGRIVQLLLNQPLK